MGFQARKGKYIRVKNGRYYYRRAIPQSYREKLGGQKEWIIPLRGQSDTERQREAQMLAGQHDIVLTAENWETPDDYPIPPDDTVEMRIGPNLELDGSVSTDPMFVRYRDGDWCEVYKASVTDDPIRRLQAEADGYFTMSQREAFLQLELEKLQAKFDAATNDDARENLRYKGTSIVHQIEAERDAAYSATVLSILARWRSNKKQAATTWKKHVQYINEFADLHGDIPLIHVTKRHVIEYVEDAHARRRPDGKCYSPTSITKRLDSIKALFAFAVEIDEIEASPAIGVKAPKDNRPKTARSWKSFEPAEVKKLVNIATDLWRSRKARVAGRPEDLETALHCLVWTGARPEEICQLRLTDVDLARYVLIITNDESEDDARPRLVKNEQSTREIPIHSRLLPLVKAHIRRSNGPLLFPTFEPRPTASELDEEKEFGILEIKGRYARPISREWTENLRTLVTNDPRKVLYSLRHSWAAESRRTGMPEHVRNAIMGHSDDNQHASKYGADADWLEEKQRHINRMNCI